MTNTAALNVEQLQSQIAELQKAAAQLDRERRAEQQRAWAEIAKNPENWEWSVRATTLAPFFRDDNSGTLDGVQVVRRIKPEVLAKWKEGGFSTFHEPAMDGGWAGMFYYRTAENILYHSGGGTLVLKDVQLCSDEQWEQLLAGNIPEKFRR